MSIYCLYSINLIGFVGWIMALAYQYHIIYYRIPYPTKEEIKKRWDESNEED